MIFSHVLLLTVIAVLMIRVVWLKSDNEDLEILVTELIMEKYNEDKS